MSVRGDAVEKGREQRRTAIAFPTHNGIGGEPWGATQPLLNDCHEAEEAAPMEMWVMLPPTPGSPDRWSGSATDTGITL